MSSNFRRDLQDALGWTAPEFEEDLKELKTFFRSLLDEHFVVERNGPQQDPEAKIRIKKAILEKYPDVFEGSKNAHKLVEAMRFIQKEQSARRGSRVRNNKKRENRRRKALEKESGIQDYRTTGLVGEDSDSSIEFLGELRVAIPSSSQSTNYAGSQHSFTQKGSTTSSGKSSQKQRKIFEFGERPAKSFKVSQVNPFDESISGPSTPPKARDEFSPSPKTVKFTEAPEQRLMEFLGTCTPKMDNWYDPLVAFGCDSMPFLEALARWDDKSLEAALRLIKDQPGIGRKLKEVDVVFLSRNLRKRL